MNGCVESVRLIQRYYNRTGIFQMNCSVTYKLAFFPLLKLLFYFYVKRTVHRQDFGAKFMTQLLLIPVMLKMRWTIYLKGSLAKQPIV